MPLARRFATFDLDMVTAKITQKLDLPTFASGQNYYSGSPCTYM